MEIEAVHESKHLNAGPPAGWVEFGGREASVYLAWGPKFSYQPLQVPPDLLLNIFYDSYTGGNVVRRRRWFSIVIMIAITVTTTITTLSYLTCYRKLSSERLIAPLATTMVAGNT